MSSREQVGSFIALDRDGDEIEVLVFKTFIEVEYDGGSETRPGVQELETVDGDSVKREAKGKYTLRSALGDRKLTSHDPNAP